jgi:lipopolysaccharide export system permease protein
MSTLQRYVQREFLKIFLMCFSGLLSTYFLVEFFQNIDLFLNYTSPLRYKMLFFLLKMPQFIYHVTPVAVLVSVLVTLSILNRNRELIAVKSSGIMLYHICYPLVMWGLIISALVFINNEFVVPHTTRQKEFIKNVRIKGRPVRSVFRQNRIWYYGENNTIFSIQLLDPAERTLEGVTIVRFDPSHSRPIERIDAKRAAHVDGAWKLRDGTVRTFDEDGTVKTVSFRKKKFETPETPGDLSQYRENPDTMNFPSLASYVEKLERSGFSPTRYVVDLYAKTSIPMISLIVAILAIPFAFRASPSGGIVASLGMSLALGFGYWIVVSIGVSLGHAGKAPPILASWGPNIFFLAVGIYLWLHMDL